MITAIRFTLLAAAACAAMACGRSNKAQQRDSMSSALPPGHVPINTPGGAPALSATAQALLDSGNTAFRVKDFDGALAYYHKATLADPAHAAPWFGTYMVGKATNNSVLADSALRMVRERAPEMQPRPGTPSIPDMPPGGAAPATPFSPHGTPPPPQGKSSS